MFVRIIRCRFVERHRSYSSSFMDSFLEKQFRLLQEEFQENKLDFEGISWKDLEK